MIEKERSTEKECSRKLAISAFNETWNYLSKKERNKEENEKMLQLAYTSLFHWSKIGTAINIERGEWLLSRVYAIIKKAEEALFHAEQCLKICKEANIKDWDIAFAYEAIVRAYTIYGRKKECKKYMELAQKEGNAIKEKEDKDLLLNDLKTICCSG